MPTKEPSNTWRWGKQRCPTPEEAKVACEACGARNRNLCSDQCLYWNATATESEKLAKKELLGRVKPSLVGDLHTFRHWLGGREPQSFGANRPRSQTDNVDG